MSQNEMILNHLQTTGSISLREAVMDYSIQSLTKRISELRKAGWKILTEEHHHPITNQKYARYVLKRKTRTR